MKKELNNTSLIKGKKFISTDDASDDKPDRWQRPHTSLQLASSVPFSSLSLNWLSFLFALSLDSFMDPVAAPASESLVFALFHEISVKRSLCFEEDLGHKLLGRLDCPLFLCLT